MGRLIDDCTICIPAWQEERRVFVPLLKKHFDMNLIRPPTAEQLTVHVDCALSCGL